MGVPNFGYTGILTSWANNSTLIAGIGEHSANFNIPAGAMDATQYAASLKASTAAPGMAGWSGSIASRLLTSGAVQAGYAGNIAIGTSVIYSLHIQNYRINIKSLEMETTEYNSTATNAGWEQHAPGILEISAQFTALTDATTAITMPFTSSTTLPTVTLTLDGTANNTLAFTGVVSQVGLAVPVKDKQLVTYSVMNAGNLTAGAGSTLFTAGAVTIPPYDYTTPTNNLMTFTLNTGRTLAGAAFWNSIDINHGPKKATDIAVGFRGYGALTPA